MKKCTELRKYVFPDPYLSSSYPSSFPSDLQCRGCLYQLPPVFHISSHPLSLSTPLPSFPCYIFYFSHIHFPQSASPSCSFCSCQHYLSRFSHAIRLFVLFWWILPPPKIFDTFLTLCIVMKRKKCVAFRHTLLLVSCTTDKTDRKYVSAARSRGGSGG